MSAIILINSGIKKNVVMQHTENFRGDLFAAVSASTNYFLLMTQGVITVLTIDQSPQ